MDTGSIGSLEERFLLTKRVTKYAVHAPWPTTYPKGEIIPEESRYVEIPSEITFRVGPVGIFDRCLCLPEGVFWHVTPLGNEPFDRVMIAKPPYDPKTWEEAFYPLPMYLGEGGTQSLPPFEEFEHIADIAFHIYGERVEALFYGAVCALSFKCPDLIPFIKKGKKIETIEEVIITLNQITSRADQEIGTPFKAVSFHGEVKEKDGILSWEMIVDV